MGCCFVPGCKSGYPRQRKEFKRLGKKNPSLFSCPLPEDLEKWNRAIPRADRSFSDKDKVCELHFDADDIERYYTHKFPDGSVQLLERGKAFLKPGSIPTIFPNLPDRFSKKSKKRKAPVERVPLVKKIKEEKNLNLPPVPDYKEQHSDELNLNDNIQLVKLPSQSWLIHTFPNYVACVRFNDAYKVDRTVVVKDDKSIKVFIYDCDVQAEETVSCVQDLSILLQKVDKYTECPGATNSTKCLGYIPMDKLGRKSTRCKECGKRKKQEVDIAKREYASKLSYHSRNFYQQMVLTNRKCARLKKKVIKLRDEIKNIKSKFTSVEMKAVRNMLLDFPVPQQEAIGACIDAAKRKGGTGQRYTIQWIYECLLIRLKNRQVYEYLRSRKILVLPSVKTLSSYIKKFKESKSVENADCLERAEDLFNRIENESLSLNSDCALSPVEENVMASNNIMTENIPGVMEITTPEEDNDELHAELEELQSMLIPMSKFNL